MGFLKIVFLITVPLTGLTVAAFRLGKELPIASRLFGNYIGLGYVYFKSILTYVKPVDHLPFEMISLARKTSQQSQALKRELKSTLKRVKDDLNSKKQETFKDFNNEAHINKVRQAIQFEALKTQQQVDSSKQISAQNKNITGNLLIYQIIRNREILLSNRQKKKNSRKFFQQL